MSIISDRLSTLIAEKGTSYRELAEKTGVSKSAIQRYAIGETEKIPIDRLIEFANVLCVAPAYLIGWTDDRYAYSINVQNENGNLPSSVIPVHKKKVPILGSIAAGVPIYAEQEYDDYETADADKHVDFALRVEGDSMEPRLLSGDVVFFRHQDDVEDGEIAAVIVGDEATLKHVYHIKGGVQLISENTKYPPMFFDEEVRIIGKAMCYKRRL